MDGIYKSNVVNEHQQKQINIIIFSHRQQKSLQSIIILGYVLQLVHPCLSLTIFSSILHFIRRHYCYSNLIYHTIAVSLYFMIIISTSSSSVNHQHFYNSHILLF